MAYELIFKNHFNLRKGVGRALLNCPRVLTLWGGIAMTEPAAKRVCTAVTSVLKRIAVEGNIGELTSALPAHDL